VVWFEDSGVYPILAQVSAVGNISVKLKHMTK
jgi:hypothetical protein